jgi:RNA polymerase sigma-70 factor, ECF subfamily
LKEQYLINGILTRNEIVFDFIFQYYYSGLCAYAEKVTGNSRISEDIVQDLFVTLWIKHNQITISSSLKNYLFTSVKNRSLDYLKHEKTKSNRIQIIQQTAEPTENLSILWMAESELEELVETCLQKLPPRCNEIFRLSRFEGFKNQEIADKLGISKRTVELQISNALKNLRLHLKPHLPLFLLTFLLK